MIGIALRRIGYGLILFVAVTAIAFIAIFANGETAVRNTLGENATEESVASRMSDLGLNQPVLLQYVQWLGGLIRGDLGDTFFTGEPVTSVLASRIPVTLSLIILALVFTALLSVAIGVIAAVRGGWVDSALQGIAVLATALPSFLIAIALAFAFAIAIPIFPATGYVPLEQSVSGWAASLFLPVVAILMTVVATAAQQFRGAMVDVLRQDYIRTLRARGISPTAIYLRHALRNAAGPGLTILALQTIALISGVVLIERIFALQGVGNLTVTSALTGDLPVVMGVVVFSTVVVVIVNTLADLISVRLNPKARTS